MNTAKAAAQIDVPTARRESLDDGEKRSIGQIDGDPIRERQPQLAICHEVGRENTQRNGKFSSKKIKV